jgi:RNA polymerase sigma-70 factor (ECF subfamily)
MEVLEQPPELLEQFASGELDAFETLFRQFQGEVFRWIVRMVRDPGVAEDLTIETFWRIHRAHARFDAKRNFGAWARRIATNVAIDYLKSGPGKATRAETVLHEHLPAANGLNPGMQRDIRERTRRAFADLPAKLQVAATLALIEERPYQEIAEALNISVGAVKLRVFRALRLLRKRLKELGIEP